MRQQDQPRIFHWLEKEKGSVDVHVPPGAEGLLNIVKPPFCPR